MGPALVRSAVLVLQVNVPEAIGRVAILGGYAVLVLFTLYVGWLKSRALYGDDESAEQRVNCSSCGARTTVDADVCSYCGEPLDGTDSDRIGDGFEATFENVDGETGRD